MNRYWREDAKCIGRDDLKWVFESLSDLDDLEDARRLCTFCPVRVDCHRNGVATGDSHYVIRGGFLPGEATEAVLRKFKAKEKSQANSEYIAQRLEDGWLPLAVQRGVCAKGHLTPSVDDIYIKVTSEGHLTSSCKMCKSNGVTPREKVKPNHCKRGHHLAGDNLYTYTDKEGRTRRYCKTCQSESNERRKAGSGTMTA